MTKKLKFEVKYESDFQVLGLFSSLSNYRLCWFINKYLNIRLSRKKDILLTPFKKDKTELFILFSYKDPELNIEYYLLNNRKDQHVLVSEPKKLDYLFLLKAKDFRFDIGDIAAELRSIQQISAVVWFRDHSEVKNLNNILYDFEHALIEQSR